MVGTFLEQIQYFSKTSIVEQVNFLLKPAAVFHLLKVQLDFIDKNSVAQKWHYILNILH
jgi:hypothetical protein